MAASKTFDFPLSIKIDYTGAPEDYKQFPEEPDIAYSMLYRYFYAMSPSIRSLRGAYINYRIEYFKERQEVNKRLAEASGEEFEPIKFRKPNQVPKDWTRVAQQFHWEERAYLYDRAQDSKEDVSRSSLLSMVKDDRLDIYMKLKGRIDKHFLLPITQGTLTTDRREGEGKLIDMLKEECKAYPEPFDQDKIENNPKAPMAFRPVYRITRTGNERDLVAMIGALVQIGDYLTLPASDVGEHVMALSELEMLPPEVEERFNINTLKYQEEQKNLLSSSTIEVEVSDGSEDEDA